ncbi:hypothetical protein BC749_10735 [Flavobacterium araucananum]|uniref:Uncharacterized protein n=1 Tax=Flavobacterium araucananum TaxID=946678 RepID=A0A227NLE7_9FLAO|nr:hypothetical protein [Flavobacterium araucananum]OXE98660.1 hypothetical protein B0A64_22460 [Flavobacterium araucananum]PWJ97239.1 hypothetical protein BC749_10735 [Flavobacterium araucananum]
MKAIEISQQNEILEVITNHIKTSAVYCFGSNVTVKSLSRKVYPEHGTSKEHIHLYLLVFVSETIENASNDISDKIKTKNQGTLTTTILLHHVHSLKNLGQDQKFFFWQIMHNAELLFQDINNPPYLNIDETPKRNLKSALNYTEQRKNNIYTIWNWVYNDDGSSSDEVKMSALHQIVEQTCLSLIRVFTGYTPNYFGLQYLFTLCEYFTSITADFFPRHTNEDKFIFKLLKQQPSTLRFSKANDVDYLFYEIVEERCGKFIKHAKILIENEIDRLNETEKEPEQTK